MTDLSATAGHVGTYGVARRLGALLRNACSGYLAWRRSRRTITQLSRLSDRSLNDIGLKRSEIVSVVLGADRGARL